MPELEFVVATYNRPAALRTCLSSLVQQTRQCRIVVVDNSPTHELQTFDRQLCNSLGVIHYDTHEFTKISGAIHEYDLYKATEIGVHRLSAPWLCFPNDDSYYVPWFAERMLAHAKEKELDLVYCDFVAGGPGGHWLMQSAPHLCQIDKTNFIIRREFFGGFNADAENYPQADGLMIVDTVGRGARHGRLDQILCVHN